MYEQKNQNLVSSKANRPTIALCCILKDEIKNLPQMLSSVEGCFDEIHLTDTGSTDGSVQWINDHAENVTKSKVFLKHFEWCDDFAKARNYSMEGVKTDYVMWMDLDDVMSDKEKFIQWRDHVMLLGDFWLAPYYYAFDESGNPNCTFIRERVIRTSKKFEWEYFIHEGMIAKEEVKAQYTHHWQIHHKRTKEDYEKDYTRNVSMLEKVAKKEELPVRLKFYYGKELFDKGRYQEAYTWLDMIMDHKDLQQHDRILTIEYMVRASIYRYQQEQMHRPENQRDKRIIAKGLSIALQGLTIAPNRAELFCLAADCFQLLGQISESLPFWEGARRCQIQGANSPTFLFTNVPAYTYVPYNQIARIKQMMGDLDGAIFEAKEAVEKFNHPESQQILNELLRIKSLVSKGNNENKTKTNEIVFSCIPNSHPYAFDEDVYKEKGIGGSETALVEVAKYLKELTGKPVIVFNTRETIKVCESGVVYRPSQNMWDYFCNFEPEVHIAWRHNVSLTKAPTYLWCHDLMTPGAENTSTFDKIICLSDFHKNYVQIQQGIPDSKIVVSRNGVNKDRFKDRPKNENKIIWPSSPDRGLERAINIIKTARENYKKDYELHVFYGLDNLYKYGLSEKADALKALMAEHDWIKYHGNVDQKTLADHMCESVLWLYPADFIETYCITAIEALNAKCFSLVREIGALKNTLRPMHDKGYAKLMFSDATTKEEIDRWAYELNKAITHREWEKIKPDEFDFSWRGVAEHFIEFMNIELEKKEVVEWENIPLQQVYRPDPGFQDIGV